MAGQVGEAIPLYGRPSPASTGSCGPDHPDSYRTGATSPAPTRQRADSGRQSRCMKGCLRASTGSWARITRIRFLARRPRRRLPDGRPARGGNPAVRAGCYRPRAGARPGSPRYAHRTEQPRRRLPDGSRRLGEAIPLYEQAVTDRERVLGPDHPDTLLARSNLAGAYQAAGRVGEAIPLYELILVGLDRVLGPDHPDTLIVRSNLAAAYQAAGRAGRQSRCTAGSGRPGAGARAGSSGYSDRAEQSCHRLPGGGSGRGGNPAVPAGPFRL